MCDIWKANHQKKELSVELLEKHVSSFVKLGVREVVLSGGEALMHSNLWKFCSILREHNIQVVLLSTGLLLEKNAIEITKCLNEVIVSLDGSEKVHDSIRNVPHGFEKLARGIKELKNFKPSFKITSRCVIQRYNYFDFVNTVAAAKDIGLDSISFLGADVSTPAFNRQQGWTRERVTEVALTIDEALAFEKILAQSFTELRQEYESKFIVESPEKMRRIVQYYKAVNGQAEFPKPICNAPWVSAVIESDGNVMPCFFHKSYGNIYDHDFLKIINSEKAVQFRRSLDMDKDPICTKCVCSLKLGLSQPS
jgi:MoaA/NifB/PqqE/SkfB family radical SAM enzyme